jgi:adenine-specific DNA-methyltransferase
MPRSHVKSLGQFFTPRPVAQLMVGLVEADVSARVVEPSAGEGVFLDALAERGFADVVGYELDDAVVQDRHKDQVHVGSFVGAHVEPARVVIGNPPYVRWKNMTDAQRDELAGDPIWQANFNSLCDLLLYFVARSVDVLEAGGELVMITPDFWLTTKHATPLRQLLDDSGSLTDVVRFGEARVFAGVASSIIIWRFVKGQARGHVDVYDYAGPPDVLAGAPVRDALSLLADPEWFHRFQAPAPKSHAAGWTLLPPLDRERAEAIERACAGATVGDACQIANGMVSGLDRAFRLPDDMELSEAEEAATIEVLKGKDIQPLRVGRRHSYLLAEAVEDEDELARDLPRLHAHIGQFREQLLARYDYGKGRQWWHWSLLRSKGMFDRPEPTLMIPCKERITNKDRLRAAVAPAGIYPTQDVSALRMLPGAREDLHYVAALLCSAPWFEWVCSKGLLKGGVAEFSERPLAALPLRRIDFNDPEDAAMHDEIVAEATSEQPQLERIDALVVRLLEC